MPLLAIEQPEHARFLVRSRQDRDADVDVALLDAHREASFARDARPADIHAREHLHAVDQRAQRRQRRVGDLAEQAVDAEAHAQLIRERFDVDVGGPFADRLFEQHAGETDDRFVLLGQRRRGRGATSTAGSARRGRAAGAAPFARSRPLASALSAATPFAAGGSAASSRTPTVP